MALTARTRLGPYEILGLIGAGGMGEVYEAKDTRLDRTVAIKVLPPHLTDPEHRARFEREAKTIAGLSHPHICSLFDVGEYGSSLFLVMERLEGTTLAERLRKGPLPIEQALEYGTQIAEALSAAHRAGIVHRDLKPANVMLTKSGVKLLDFGLAKLKAPSAQPAFTSAVSQPTLSEPLTVRGTILGTLQYMAPEQLEGKETDARTDIWALGLVLYEMVAGRRAFEAASEVSLIGAILERQPQPLAECRPLTPPALERLVQRCLVKSPDGRWDTAHDVAEVLRWINQTGAMTAPTSQPRNVRWRAAGLLSAVVGLTAVATGAVVWTLRPPESRPQVVRSLLDISPADELNGDGVGREGPTSGGSRTAMAWTPDGRAFVFVGRRGGVQQLYVRDLDHNEARALTGTTGAQTPAISPDGAWVAFWSDGAIRKVALAGGPSLVVCDGVTGAPDGMSWSADERLVYAPMPDGALWQVPSGGGTPTVLTKPLLGEWRHVLPQVLPGGEAVLYTVRRFPWIWSQEEIVAQSLTTGARTVLLHDAVDARYIPSGHLVFLRRGTLFAVPFDPVHLKVRGSPVPLLEDVAQALTGGNSGEVTGAGQFSVAPTGSLAYVSGPMLPYPNADVLTFTRQGTVTAVAAPVRSYAGVARLSPDGRRLALVVRTPVEQSVWLYDLMRGTLVKLTAGGVAIWPQWTPNEQRLTFARNTAGRFELVWQHTDGSGSAEVLLAKEGFTPSSWSRDGRELLAVTVTGDIWVMSFEGSAPTLHPLIQSPAIEDAPDFAPDGRAVAYESNESGRFEVYVRAYPGSGQKIQVSVEGGQAPAWNPRGGELFFVGGGDESHGEPPRLMAADVRTSPVLIVGQPRALFEITQGAFSCRPDRCYDVAPDGQRFFAIQRRTPPQPPPVRYVSLIQNWFEELKAKVPGQ